MNQQRKIISIQDLVVKFRVRSRSLTAIRGITFDIYDEETIAIVGESGSGKSVLTKSLTNMLESNGYIAKGAINYYPSDASKKDPLAEIKNDVDLVQYHRNALDLPTKRVIEHANKKQIKDLATQVKTLSSSSPKTLETKLNKQTIKLNNLQKKDERSTGIAIKKAKVKEKIDDLKETLSLLNNQEQKTHHLEELNEQISDLKQENYNYKKLSNKKKKSITQGIKILADYLNLKDDDRDVFIKETIIPYYTNLQKQPFLKITENHLMMIFEAIINQANYEFDQEELDFVTETWSLEKRNVFKKKSKSEHELRNLRGGTIATIFQDPMTSLNPLLTIGYQLIEAIQEHQKVSGKEAKKQAIDLLSKVGITNPEKRMKDIPGKYSGGMRQRVVIAMALACKPKILICDEPTTALDVTIQAQILNLIKELKKEYKFTVIFITHDLGVVANIADRVAVVYAGQIIEYGTTEEVFFNPQHPYTWALLSSLPQLGKEGEKLYALNGTPPSLFNKIKGDAFAPRNAYALDIDYVYEPPFFKVSQTHYAKTWLLDKRAPKVERPVELSRLRGVIEEQKVGD